MALTFTQNTRLRVKLEIENDKACSQKTVLKRSLNANTDIV